MVSSDLVRPVLYVLRYIFERLPVCYIIPIEAAVSADSQEGKTAIHESVMKPQKTKEKKQRNHIMILFYILSIILYIIIYMF